ncbi:hypothetical protein [Aquabacterium sp.]|uniref:hypothetical protein n=1 Tax=Aquabacterium sp. TaxID=1872578 RepID=UPI00378448F0
MRDAATLLLLAALAGALPCAAGPAAQGAAVSSAAPPPATSSADNPAESPAARLAAQVLALKQLPLPDAWYPARGATVAERFAATWRAMPAGPDKPASVDALMARYDNGGRPFIHSVWFNRPLRCAHCNEGGADGFTTVVSVRAGVVLTLTARELHEAQAHGIDFPADKRTVLQRLLAAPPARP